MKYILLLGLLVTSYSASATRYKCNINNLLIFSQFQCSNKQEKKIVKSVNTTNIKSKLAVNKTSHLSKIEHKLFDNIKLAVYRY